MKEAFGCICYKFISVPINFICTLSLSMSDRFFVAVYNVALVLELWIACVLDEIQIFV